MNTQTANGHGDSAVHTFRNNLSENVVDSVHALYWAAKCALADLEGIMPEHDPSGDREHPGWATIKDLRKAIRTADKAQTLNVIL